MQNELTAERVEKAITSIEYKLSCGILPGARETFETCLAALREVHGREEGCEWCKAELRFECYLIDDEGHTASIENNVVQTIIADYCPRCGRRLTEGSEK